MAFFPDNVLTWRYKTKHVQSGQGGAAGKDFDATNFVRGASILIVAGPRHCPTLPWNSGIASQLIPVGVLQTGSIQQQKQLEEVFEIGSERRYFVTGRTFFSLQATRIMLDGGSLMAALSIVSPTGVVPNPYVALPGSDPGDEPGDMTLANSRYFLNLASTFFNTPLGLLVIDADNNDVIAGGAYLEDCYIQTYNRQITAAQTVVAENCLIKFDKIRAVDNASLAAVTGLTAIG